MAKNGKEGAFWVSPLFHDDGSQMSSGIDAQGREHPDPVPLEVPLSELQPYNDMLAMIQRTVHSEFLRRKAEEEGFDTPEEADDFSDEDDDYELTPYQRQLMEKDLNPDPALGAAEPVKDVGEGAGGPSPSLSASKPVVEPESGSEVGVQSRTSRSGSVPRDSSGAPVE